MGSSSSSPSVPSSPQSTDMAVETEWSCPICYDTEDSIAYVSPCHHSFCLGCIMRWAKDSSLCPLCRGPMEEVRFSIRGENDYLKCAVVSSEESPEDSSQAGRDPNLLANSSTDHPAASSPQEAVLQEEQGAVETEARASVGDAMPNIWARLFQEHQDLLNPVLPWLHQELEAVFGRQWWLAMGAETLILQALCLYGLNEEAVVQWVQPALGDRTATLVHELINVIMRQCSDEAQRLLYSLHAGEEEEDHGNVGGSSPTSSSSTSSSSTSSSPTRPSSTSSSSSTNSSSTSPSSTSSRSTSSCSSREETPGYHAASSSSPADSNMEEHLRTPEATLQRDSSRSPSVPVPVEHEQPQEEPEEVAVAGPSAPGSSHSPSSPQHSRKRRASSPPAYPQPRKRPRR